MLPEVRATVTMRFHDDAMREIPFFCAPHLKISCQNVINQAFATPWILLLSEQTVGVPGRGSRQCGTGFLFRSGQRAILKRAWHRHGECLAAVHGHPAAQRRRPRNRSERTQSSLVIRVQQRRFSSACAQFIYDLIGRKRSMRTWLQNAWSHCSSEILNRSAQFGAAAIAVLFLASGAFARPESEAG